MSFLPPPFDILVMIWPIAALVMLGFWCAQCFHHNAVLADVGFCLVFGVTSLVSANVIEGDPLRKWLLGAMGAFYAFRLAWHLLAHRIYRKIEDARYQALRGQMGKWAQLGFFIYFQGQAVAVVMFLMPLVVLMANPYPPFGVGEILGMLLWALAIVGEVLADHQLGVFRENPKNAGKTCRVGLWRYSRHPNYFCETLIWCAYVVMAIGVPMGWYTLIGPVAMTVALLKITGIPYAEAQALVTRGEDYRAYQRTTSVFFPWFPKKE
ncbi:MAG: membrane protein [Nitrospirales bacterium]|nr:MAG: membrane protein [Nitrospirales bacterium]